MNDQESSEIAQKLKAEIADFYDTALCGFLFTKVDGTILNANQTFLNWVGLSVQQIENKVRFRDTLNIGSKIYYETNYSPLLRMQGYLKEVALDLKTAENGSLAVLVSSKTIQGSEGKPILISSTLFAIADRRNYEKELLSARQIAEDSEEALQTSHEWFETTLGSIGDAVITVAEDRTVSYLNKVAENLTGWSLADAIGRPMNEVFNILNEKTGEPASNPVDRVLREGITAGLEDHTALIRRDGTRIIIEDSAAPIKTETGKLKGVVLVFRDVTQKHREEQDRIKLVDDLTKEKGLRETFVSTLSHDLRTPLAAVKMSAQLIARNSTLPDKLAVLSSRIISNVDRVTRMIEDLLDANQIKAGETLNLDLQPMDLVSVVKETVRELSITLEDRMVLDCPDEAILVVWNANAIRRMLENLCTNAFKYGRANSPINVTLRQACDEVSISVHNMGNPIPTAELGKLFEPFKRVSTSGNLPSPVKGWGLGLTLVKGFTHAHEGRIEVASTEEQGTTFKITLPKDPKAAALKKECVSLSHEEN